MEGQALDVFPPTSNFRSYVFILPGRFSSHFQFAPSHRKCPKRAENGGKWRDKPLTFSHLPRTFYLMFLYSLEGVHVISGSLPPTGSALRGLKTEGHGGTSP